ncbi:hypothetical protein SPFM12_00198 [Salmonella phage SPFM12]|nr:hypothetical protein SPFM12_00198 [Salmonella phage SPFM12]
MTITKLNGFRYRVGQDLTKTTLPGLEYDLAGFFYECESFVYESRTRITLPYHRENPAQCHVEYDILTDRYILAAMASFESACAERGIVVSKAYLTWFDLSKGKPADLRVWSEHVVVRYRKLSLNDIITLGPEPPEPDGRVSALLTNKSKPDDYAETVYTPLTTERIRVESYGLVIDFNHHHSQTLLDLVNAFIIFL